MLSGVPGDKIIDVNGHRNVLSLNSYEGDDENQAKELSNTISGCKQKCNTQQQSNSSPNIKERLPPQARTSSNNVNFSTINNFTGTVNFYGGFPGPSNFTNAIFPKHRTSTFMEKDQSSCTLRLR